MFVEEFIHGKERGKEEREKKDQTTFPVCLKDFILIWFNVIQKRERFMWILRIYHVDIEFSNK